MTYAKTTRELHPVTLRSKVRHMCLSALGRAWQYTGSIKAQRSKNRVQFLYLHHVLPDEETSFRHLLNGLKEHYQFISYSEAVEKIWNGNIDGSYLVLSFDDGFKNCLNAASIMNEVGAKACFFVCPPMISETNFTTIERFCRDRLRKAPLEFMTWADLETLLAMGHEIGGHTMTHANLGQTPLQQTQQELDESFMILKQRLGNIKHFAWPYGKFSCITPEAVQAVFEAGFVSCASGARGCHVVASADTSSLCIRRDHVMAHWPLLHVNYFLARSSTRASAKDNDFVWTKHYSGFQNG
jgi:peptidoglycan/xylan/chitin deacetylase (PgdA/CDA1 family)